MRSSEAMARPSIPPFLAVNASTERSQHTRGIRRVEETIRGQIVYRDGNHEPFDSRGAGGLAQGRPFDSHYLSCSLRAGPPSTRGALAGSLRAGPSTRTDLSCSLRAGRART